MTNFSFEFFYKIFTEDASRPLLYYGAKKSKMTKNSNQGGGGPALIWSLKYKQDSCEELKDILSSCWEAEYYQMPRHHGVTHVETSVGCLQAYKSS